ncbi:phage regulator Rha-like protein [Lacrimispora xylanisolvens]|uniref:Phage regulator Rha-like protein n=1 Tax=Lacrimispora xylanisolvens TaxID=384636 RepID=A0A2S6HJ41_9FIRM|nr:Rha family transcriptional regulator [Hungatella xylanolytica]PPK77498.1 phage regulator Rha-like protein [Hungatella xylanolytica]
MGRAEIFTTEEIKKTQTITTLEIAEMMDVPHADLLKKLEGRKDRKGYIQILNEGQMSVVDYFKKSTYIDAKGEERPCYETTRLGCDFLANKSTGEKGIIFTAKYVKRFYELEEAIKPKRPQTYIEALEELIQSEKQKEQLRLELDRSKDWYSIKRVAALNGVDWKTFDWRKLKRTGMDMGYEVKKIFDANYGEVNTYHREVWEAVYPEYEI